MPATKKGQHWPWAGRARDRLDDPRTPRGSSDRRGGARGGAEWLKGARLERVVYGKPYRGFESLSLRHCLSFQPNRGRD